MKQTLTIVCILLSINTIAAQQNEEKAEPNRVIKILNAMSEEGDSIQQDSIVVPTIPVQTSTARVTEAKANEAEKEAEETKGTKKAKKAQEAKEAKELKKALEAKRAQEEKAAKEQRKAQELKEAQEAKAAKELLRAQELRRAQEEKAAKEQRKAQELKEAQEAEVSQEAKDIPAQQGNTFYVDGQVRARGEYNHGAITPRELNDDAAVFFNERARITMGYERQNLQLRASVQHTGVWGQDAMNDRNGRVAMNEAWAKGYTNNGLFLQVGRQVLSYDDERILGASDWNVAGNSHDALRMGYESTNHTVHLFGALNQTAENDRAGNYIGPMPYKNMEGLWYHFQARRIPFGLSVLLMDVGVERTRLGEATGDVKYFSLAGTHLTYKVSDFNFAASFYFETGTEAMSRKDISAYMASGRAAYNGDIVGGFLGYDYLSGNNGRNTNQHAFNPLYGTNHKFYGAMDYFTGTVNCGLQDPHGGIFVNLGRKRADVGRPVTISGTYHYFLTGEKYGDYDWTIGHEADFQVTARLLRDFTITAGYSFMLGTKTFELLKGGNSDIWQDWGYLTFSFTPRLFKLNW